MKKPPKKKEAVKKKKVAETHNGKEKTFDFGGLPDRDLKKTLGC